MNTRPTAKNILIFGDSYTFGKIPGGLRHPADVRFTGVMQTILGVEYNIIEEGLRGRMLEGENPYFPYRNGAEQFGAILGSHLPLDLIVLFLGTNDANNGAGKSPAQIVAGYDGYLEKVNWWADHLGFTVPKIMLVSAPPINEEASIKAFGEFFKGARAKLLELAPLVEKYTAEKNLAYFNSAPYVTISDVDGIHLDEEANRKLGEALTEKIRAV